jgi:hypothetical protein
MAQRKEMLELNLRKQRINQILFFDENAGVESKEKVE